MNLLKKLPLQYLSVAAPLENLIFNFLRLSIG